MSIELFQLCEVTAEKKFTTVCLSYFVVLD